MDSVRDIMVSMCTCTCVVVCMCFCGCVCRCVHVLVCMCVCEHVTGVARILKMGGGLMQNPNLPTP